MFGRASFRELRRTVGALHRWDDIREWWQGSILPIPVDLVGPQASVTTKEFLVEVGLPTVNALEFTFYHDERLLTPIVRGSEAI